MGPAVIHRMGHENRRGFFGHLFFVGEELNHLGVGVVSEQVGAWNRGECACPW